MADAYDNERYEDAPNFNNRFKVETNMNGEIVDHRTDFQQEQYRHNMQDNPQPVEGPNGFPVMLGTVQAPKKKPGTKQVKHGSRKLTSAEQKLQNESTKDLKNRGIK